MGSRLRIVKLTRCDDKTEEDYFIGLIDWERAKILSSYHGPPDITAANMARLVFETKFYFHVYIGLRAISADRVKHLAYFNLQIIPIELNPSMFLGNNTEVPTDVEPIIMNQVWSKEMILEFEQIQREKDDDTWMCGCLFNKFKWKQPWP